MSSSSQIFQEIQRFSPVIAAWAVAAGVSREDVRQEIAVAVLAGADVACAVPAALGIRKLGGLWTPNDPTIRATHEEAIFENISADDSNEVTDDTSGIADALAGGTDRVASRCGVCRRAAQMRVKAQAARFAACGDLFAAGEK